MPFIRKQSLKALGDGIDYLADKLLTQDDEEAG
jgi:hypothetical protein